MKRLLTLTCCAALGLVSVAAFAHSGAKGIVKERMDMMSAISKDTKTMAAMARGRSEIDWEAITKAGERAVMIGEHFPMKFPEDSFKHPSEALKTILSEAEDFQAQSKALLDAGQALAAAAQSEDLAGFKTAFGAYAATCKACHSKYRE